jgi:hypothetical protein
VKTLVVDDEYISRLLLRHLVVPYGECHIEAMMSMQFLEFETISARRIRLVAMRESRS